jgi:glucoamylase
MEPIEPWLDRQYRHAATAMLRSISPVGIVKVRPGFGQTVRPCRGAIVASPVLASYDPEPDYFFHWYRDSAVIIDALRLLYGDGSIGAAAREHLAAFVHFSHALLQLDGRALVRDRSWRAAVAPDFTQFLRSDADLGAAHGEAIAGETRVNPDGTLDISSWPRPQHDGLSLRALALLRWLPGAALEGEAGAELAALIRFDLDFTVRHWREPSFDIWEEERGQHYYTLRVAAAALVAGAGWIAQLGEAELARHYRAEAQAIHRALDDFWVPDAGYYRSRVLSSGAQSTKELDIAVILAAIHSASPAEADRHSAQDPRMHSTLERLESLFEAAYAINRGRSSERGPAMGRYAGDIYYSGGAYFFSTLGAAEYCFCAARGTVDAGAWIRRGDAYLRTVRAYIPSSGAMSEQFDQHTGAQTSARELAWSYAAFISCVHARREAMGLLKRS